ncbi:MAG: CmcJ/NvfI family oxidoreductase [Gammaproteobacteria bacterium]|nr:CmcJ/NvfI family oxidoreductase [Gammaproteobacteria bacterium]
MQDHVNAPIRYTVNTGVKPVSLSLTLGGRIEYRNCTFDEHVVKVRNGRREVDDFIFDKHGFVFVRHATQVKDFFDRQQVEADYYPEAGALIKRVTGAYRVHIFDYTVRSGDQVKQEQGTREPLKQVHNDYTDWSGPQRVRDLLPEEAEDLLRHRFMIVQVWRPIGADIVSEPLAVCDAQSLAQADLIPTERRHPNRVGETYTISYNPAHRWYYFPEMRRDEAIVFKVYDSAAGGNARFTAHGSFDDPHTPDNAPPRESIELRALVFFR